MKGLGLVKRRRSISTQKTTRKRKMVRKLKVRIKQVKTEMAQISKEQNFIKERQKEAREKFQEIECECAQLIKESNFISQLNEDTQVRLDLMSKILRARECKDLAKANDLTRSLRELIAKSNKQKQALPDC